MKRLFPYVCNFVSIFSSGQQKSLLSEMINIIIGLSCWNRLYHSQMVFNNFTKKFEIILSIKVTCFGEATWHFVGNYGYTIHFS